MAKKYIEKNYLYKRCLIQKKIPAYAFTSQAGISVIIY